MALSVIIAVVTCFTMIMGILFFPKIKLKRLEIDSYWVIVLVGALLLLICRQTSFADVGKVLIANTATNPLKILVLFISMTILSVFLDELGFFSYLANVTLSRARTSQIKLFLYLYLTVSVLTVFTSNDIIILSFTPFICYFSKNARISPIPYLAAEFVAANTWSMALIIGNPTNIYLATASEIGFVDYVKVMLLPTVLAGAVAFLMLYLLFRKQLLAPIEGEAQKVQLNDKFSLWVGIAHLGICTVMLAISSYIGLEMWYISLAAVVSLFLWQIGIAIVRRQKPAMLLSCLKRAPWQLIPFVLSMFVIIIVLAGKGVTAELTALLAGEPTILKYGVVSFLAANLINNIPMSVLFYEIASPLTGATQMQAIYASIVGSNIGAFFTPIGALAGIMWSEILNTHGLKFGYRDFLKIGVTIALPTLLTALLSLYIVL